MSKKSRKNKKKKSTVNKKVKVRCLHTDINGVPIHVYIPRSSRAEEVMCDEVGKEVFLFDKNAEVINNGILCILTGETTNLLKLKK